MQSVELGKYKILLCEERVHDFCMIYKCQQPLF